jgi:amino acid transporter
MSSVEHQGLLEAVPSPDSLEVEPATLFILSSSGDDISVAAPELSGFPLPPPPRTLTNLNGLALVIGLQIGSGIFATPSVVITKVPSTPAAVSVWVLAGVLVWTGAASFIELATRVPQNGGIQEYLRYCYGDVYGFMFAWIWLLVSRPYAMAMVALVFFEYLFKAVFPDVEISVWILKGTALLAVALITVLLTIST